MTAAEAQIAADGSGAMFDRIAGRYDLLNGIMSFGMHGLWRRSALRALRQAGAQVGLEAPRARVLDLASGTADVAIQLAKQLPEVVVDGIDPSAGMLEVGDKKALAKGLSDRIRLTVGVAESLPFEDKTFQGATMAFGIRNVPDRPTALREVRRVLVPGAPFVILELSEPPRGVMGALARLHMRAFVPLVGAMLSMPSAYSYLPDSIRAFPAPDAFCEHMRAAGFGDVTAKRLFPGVCHLFVARA